MSFNFRGGFLAGAAVALAIGIYLAWLWQPERQIRLHAMHLMAHVQNKNWAKLPDFIGADFQDGWGDDRERLLARLREVFSYTHGMKMTAPAPQIRVQDREGFWTAIVKVDGEDSEMTALIKERINSLGAPFELRWRRESGKPLDWKLISASNPDLKINDRY
jgi:hypothetical protein